MGYMPEPKSLEYYSYINQIFNISKRCDNSIITIYILYEQSKDINSIIFFGFENGCIQGKRSIVRYVYKKYLYCVRLYAY